MHYLLIILAIVIGLFMRGSSKTKMDHPDKDRSLGELMDGELEKYGTIGEPNETDKADNKTSNPSNIIGNITITD